jgi:hypothetical protein
MTESLDQAAAEWRAYIDPLAGIAGRLLPQIPHPHDPQLRRELYRSIFAQISSAYFALLCADPQHPDFWPYLCSAYNWGAMNPDDDYYASPLDDTGVYRISGFRGTVKRIDFQIGTGSLIPRGTLEKQAVGLTLANYDLDSVAHGEDGAFEVILSPERPAGYTGDWWQLHKGTTYTMVRQISYDWINEVSGRLAIERLDRAAVKPRPSAAELEENLKQVARWTEDTIQLSIMFAAAIRQQQGINKLGYKDLTEYGEIVTQKYVYGGFELAPGEALIVEFKVPDICRYWSIHLTDDLAYVLDWIHRQTFLNGHTARVDPDGVFRGVISAEDPGVANWLDTAGYATGIIQVRWEECSEWPDHKITKVRLADVRDLLPADTLVVTKEERDAIIRRRRTGAQLRKRW